MNLYQCWPRSDLELDEELQSPYFVLFFFISYQILFIGLFAQKLYYVVHW